MRVAIMQPYFFPYLGYFQLINASDRFVLMNDVQYIRHGWINRNRILKPHEGFQYIILPLVKHSAKTLIRDIRIMNAVEYKIKMLRQLDHYRRNAPYFEAVRALLGSCLFCGEEDITRMNAHCLKAVCDYIGIRFRVEIASEMGFDYSNVKQTADWALRMSEQLGAEEYLNLPGGRSLYDKAHFLQYNLRLRFLEPVRTKYNQHRDVFEPSLSIIDVLMFNEPAEVRAMLNDYELS